ncbi:hypothetical protein BGAL_0526g00050 [Botrytis galanthina]|uniref:Cytochrome P450 n=1 Tax=Botrytis galanthina TaxID=278940 RepID=A0A4S8QWH4_9HELO|nr:hypothetical protein BGAL_0526g00050 [Botrytis galanthina]
MFSGHLDWLPFELKLCTRRLYLASTGGSHASAFMDNADALFNRGYKYFESDEPFALTVGGRTIIVTRGPQELSEVWKNSTALSFDPFIVGVFKSFGQSHKFIERVFRTDLENLVRSDARSDSKLINENPSGKCYVHLQSTWLKSQLIGNDELTYLHTKYHSHLNSILEWKCLSQQFVLSQNEKYTTISLARFSRYTISRCAMKTFLGDRIFEMAPSFAEDYQKYEDDSWKIFFQYPHFMAKDLHVAKEHVLKDLIKYFALPREQRPGVAWIFETMYREMRSLDLDPHDISGVIMLIVWAINNNAHHMAFWMLAHMLCNPSLLSQVRNETDRTVSPDGSIDIELLINGCPTLNAVWLEVLRIYNAGSVARQAERDITIGHKIISRGNTIMSPFRQLHMNTDIFGSDAHGFNPHRFLLNKNLHRNKGYVPFGGGHTYCPGRFFAQREVFMFIALSLYRYEFELDPEQLAKDGGVKVPEVNLKIPSAAAMGPASDLAVRIALR